MTSRAANALLVLAACSVGVVTCAAPTEVEVEVYSEIDCTKRPIVGISGGADPSALGEGALLATSTVCDSVTRRAGSLVIQPSGDADDAFFVQIVTRNDDQPIENCTAASHYGGCIVARRKVRFSRHEKLALRVDLRLKCLDVRCDDPSTTCAQGKCVPAVVPERCEAPCDETKLGVETSVDGGAPLEASASDAAPPDAGGIADAPLESGTLPDGGFLTPLIGVIAAGDDHSCVLESVSGDVFCWGSNFVGQMGIDSTDSNTHAITRVHLPGPAERMWAGEGHAFAALRADHSVVAWGNNESAQLAPGPVASVPTPIAAQTLNGTPLVISGYFHHSCAVVGPSFAVDCWGSDGWGEVGDGITGYSATITDVLDLGGTAISVTTGINHSCAALSSGAVKCWGINGKSQLGDNTLTQSARAVTVPGIVNAMQVAAGDDHTCALLATGEVVCWGDNSGGAVANPEGDPIATPTPVTLPQKATFIGAGVSHNCALLEDRNVVCWGNDSWGQINGTPVSATKSPLPSGSPPADFLTVGANHNCSVAGKTVTCWGSNSRGQLGDGTTAPRPGMFSFSIP